MLAVDIETVIEVRSVRPRNAQLLPSRRGLTNVDSFFWTIRAGRHCKDLRDFSQAPGVKRMILLCILSF
jgi:hypothetical protein